MVLVLSYSCTHLANGACAWLCLWHYLELAAAEKAPLWMGEVGPGPQHQHLGIPDWSFGSIVSVVVDAGSILDDCTSTIVLTLAMPSTEEMVVNVYPMLDTEMGLIEHNTSTLELGCTTITPNVLHGVGDTPVLDVFLVNLPSPLDPRRSLVWIITNEEVMLLDDDGVVAL